MPALAEPRCRPRLFESDGFDQWADEGNMDASKVLHPLCLHTPSYTEADPFPPKFWKESASIMKGASSGIRGRMSEGASSNVSAKHATALLEPLPLSENVLAVRR